MLNPFDNDIFTMASLTQAINEVQYVPHRLGDLGLFHEEGITTTTAIVETDGMEIGLVPSRERGAPGDPTTGDKRRAVTFRAVHLPTPATIMADEVQNIRSFGSDDQLQAIQSVVNKRLAKMARRLDLTHEFQRIGAVKGQILDSDGVTVLVDLFSAFDISQVTVDFDLDDANTDVQMRCLDVQEAIEVKLGDVAFTGVHVFCGSAFWRDLISHPDVKEPFKYYQAGAERITGDARKPFEFGDLLFERYRGGVGGMPFIDPDVAYAVPVGVEGLFQTNFAPADYMDTVNTIGLPFYSSSEPMKHNKGVELEGQSNPITLNTRPGSVIRLHRNLD